MSDAFLEALTIPRVKLPGPGCGVKKLLATMPPTHRDAVQQEIDGLRAARNIGTAHRHTGTSLTEILNEFGYYLRPLTMNRHIGRRCSCD
jgi:hypothetical protein